MDITISGRHLEVTPAIREYAQSKFAKLSRFFNRLQGIEVIADAKDRKFAIEVIVKADRTDAFVAKADGDDLYACMDEAVDKLERQLTDHKEKIRHHKGRTPMGGEK